MNEPLIANSITIPPEGTADYYKFFEIEEHKEYIEETLAHYEKFKGPKRIEKTRNNKKPKAPMVAMGGAGGPPPRRSPYSSRTRRAPRRV